MFITLLKKIFIPSEDYIQRRTLSVIKRHGLERYINAFKTN